MNLADIAEAITSYHPKADLDIISATTDENLIASLTMGCPFTANEKQALLEAAGRHKHGDKMIAIIEKATALETATASG